MTLNFHSSNIIPPTPKQNKFLQISVQQAASCNRHTTTATLQRALYGSNLTFRRMTWLIFQSCTGLCIQTRPRRLKREVNEGLILHNQIFFLFSVSVTNHLFKITDPKNTKRTTGDPHRSQSSSFNQPHTHAKMLYLCIF